MKLFSVCLECSVCGVVGVFLRDPKPSQWETVRQLVLESQARGKHATGISWVKGGRVHTISQPLPASSFLSTHLLDMGDYIEGNCLSLIAHCRYSTSDLQYNQPIQKQDVSVSHNGVISQAFPEKWEALFGGSYTTKNDTEILVNAVARKREALEEFPTASVAAIELEVGGLRAYRNGKRPLHLTSVDNGWFIYSTADIARRCGLSPQAVQYGVACRVGRDGMRETNLNLDGVDLQ